MKVNSRILSAALLLPVVLSLLWFVPVFYFACIVSILMAAAAVEWIRMWFSNLPVLYLSYAVMVLFASGLLLLAPIQASVAMLFCVCLYLWGEVFFYQARTHAIGLQSKVWAAVVGFGLLAPFPSLVVYLRGWMGGSPLGLLYVLLIAWVADSVAYFAGMRWGRHKLIPRVSPGKSWEGFLVSLLVTSLMCAGFVFFILPGSESRMALLVTSVLAIILTTMGDLSISVVKRVTGVKDTGGLIPGHGGLLDRLDSVFAVVMVFSLAGYYFIGQFN